MLATATTGDYARTLRAVAADPSVDSVISIFLRPLTTHAADVANAVLALAREGLGGKPLLAVFMGADQARADLSSPDVTVPAYAFPESAARTLAHAVRYAEWRRQPVESPFAPPDARRDEAAALISAALGRFGSAGGWLDPEEVAALFSCYGIPLAAQRIANTPDEAADHAEALGGDVALKAVAPGLVHKTEAGAVRLGLRGRDQVADAAAEMEARLSSAAVEADAGVPDGPTVGRVRFLIQQMVPRGIEMIVGIVHDPQFGPVVACGAGGALVELLRDVSIRLAPLAPADATAMLHALKSYPLLTGYRGQPPADVPALEDLVLRVSALAEDLPQIVELDCNPVVALPHGAIVVDARVRIATADPPRPLSARR